MYGGGLRAKATDGGEAEGSSRLLQQAAQQPASTATKHPSCVSWNRDLHSAVHKTELRLYCLLLLATACLQVALFT